MILSAQSIRKRIGMVSPFCEKTQEKGLSYGLSAAGYDIRVREEFLIMPGQFKLCSSIEHFNLPTDVMMKIVDKSTWARSGLFVQNTVSEPGWRGFLTLELTNQGISNILVEEGSPIAQAIFELLDEPTLLPYNGKYQDQPSTPINPIVEL